MIRPILQVPDDRLRVISVPYPPQRGMCHPAQLAAIEDLIDTFAATSNCIGLAAPQIACPWRAIVVDVSPARNELYAMVNPIITKASDDLQSVNDGCMSVFHGKQFMTTKRPKRLTVEWLDPLTWEPRKQKFTGLLAACVHHEVDHLRGILVTDRAAEVRK